MPGPGEAGCTKFQSPEDIRNQWPTMEYLPRPEPSKDGGAEDHKKWEKEYPDWRDRTCDRRMGGYFCRQHGKWITCEDLAAGVATKDRCPPHHSNDHQTADEHLDGAEAFTQQDHADAAASTTYPPEVNTNTVEEELAQFDSLSIEDPGAGRQADQSLGEGLSPSYSDLGYAYQNFEEMPPFYAHHGNTGYTDDPTIPDPGNLEYGSVSPSQATEWPSSQLRAHDSAYTEPNGAENLSRDTHTSSGKHLVEAHGRRHDRSRTSGESTSRHDGKHSVYQTSKPSRDHRGKGSSSHRRVASHDSKSTSTKSKSSKSSQTTNYTQPTTSTENQQPPSEYAEYYEYQTNGWDGYDVSGNYDPEHVYAGSEHVYAGSEHVYAGSEHVYAGSEQAHTGSGQPYIGSEQAYTGSEQAYTTSGQIHALEEEGYEQQPGEWGGYYGQGRR